MPDRFRLKKIPYGVYRSEIRSAPALGGPFIWFEAHMGFCLGFPIAPGGGRCLRGVDDFGKMSTRGEHEDFLKKIVKTLDFLKIRAYSTIVGPPKNDPMALNRKPWGLSLHRGHFREKGLPRPRHRTRHRRSNCNRPHRLWFPAPHGSRWNSSIYSSQSSSSQGALPMPSKWQRG